MGDPTLRLHTVAPVNGLTGSLSGGQTVLAWQPSPDANAGYHVYRAPSISGPFQRLTDRPLASTTYADPALGMVYMVRSVRKEVSPSGSYLNASQGVFQDTLGTFNPPRLDIARSGQGVVLSWPASFVALDYRLEAAPTLSSPNWSGVTNALQTSNSVNTVTVDTADSGRFFRLTQP